MTRIKIADLPTDAPDHLEKDEAQEISKDRAKDIADLHQQMVAEGKNSLLIILQGMDASGKDGAMRNVFGECAPFGVRTVGWKKPTELEFRHDFLWRIHKEVPAKGELVIFNRSHYEDVLIQRVHGWIDEDRVKMRMDAINAFEKLLIEDNKTTILKFFLNISHDQQEEELNERLQEPDKYYKHNPGDWKEREHWDAYMKAYEDVLNWSDVPWHVIPVDQRWYRDYLMTDIVLKALKDMDMRWPELATE
ncbi:MAG: PPK2 family polyphosphate kinase [Bacteroidota bacterium]